MKTCIIFGGTGFIGVFFATFLLKKDFGRVILVDIQSIDDKEFYTYNILEYILIYF